MGKRSEEVDLTTGVMDGDGVNAAAQGEGGKVLGAVNISSRIGQEEDTRSEKDSLMEEEDTEDEKSSAADACDTKDHDDYSGRFIPNGRTRVEPPMFDYDKFIDQQVPSKKRLEALFPERRDIDKRTKFGDTQTELHLLQMYDEWVVDMADHPESVKPKRFYEALDRELEYDIKQVYGEYQDGWQMAPSDLGRWEFDHLDQDGKTKKIQADLETGIDIFKQHQPGYAEAWEKYKHLAPEGYKPQFLMTGLEWWEFHRLDKDGKTKKIQADIKNRVDIFKQYQPGHAEAWEKYKHLAPEGYKPRFLMSGLERWEYAYLGKNGDMRQIERYLQDGEDFFTKWDGGEEAWKKYMHLAPEGYVEPRFTEDSDGDDMHKAKLEEWPAEAHRCLQENLQNRSLVQQHWTRGIGWSTGLRLQRQTQRVERTPLAENVDDEIDS